MSAAGDAIEKATYTLLTTGEPIGIAVFQHVPEDTDPPVIIIGDLETEPLDAKDDGDERATLTIVTVIEGEARKPLLDAQAKIKTKLHGARVTEGAWTLAYRFISSSAALAPDGAAYVGESRFEILALGA